MDQDIARPLPISRSEAMAGRVPPHAFFLVSALFHYLGPSFAVLLFDRLAPLGVAWLRIAMARLGRAHFALLLSLLPATAALVGFVVLRQVPSGTEIAGIALVAVGVLLHREAT